MAISIIIVQKKFLRSKMWKFPVESIQLNKFNSFKCRTFSFLFNENLKNNSCILFQTCCSSGAIVDCALLKNGKMVLYFDLDLS